MADWQPIETAPKDGTLIDLWHTEGGAFGSRIADAYWAEGRFRDGGYNRWEAGWAAPLHGMCCEDGLVHGKVTHWRALPEAPAGEASYPNVPIAKICLG